MNDAPDKIARQLGKFGGILTGVTFVLSLILLPGLLPIAQGVLLFYAIPGIAVGAIAGFGRLPWLMWTGLLLPVIVFLYYTIDMPRVGYLAMFNHYILDNPIQRLQYYEHWSHAANVLVPPAHVGLTLLSYWAVYFYCHLRVIAKREKEGLCIHCAYDLEGNESGICPECGTVIHQHESNES